MGDGAKGARLIAAGQVVGGSLGNSRLLENADRSGGGQSRCLPAQRPEILNEQRGHVPRTKRPPREPLRWAATGFSTGWGPPRACVMQRRSTRAPVLRSEGDEDGDDENEHGHEDDDAEHGILLAFTVLLAGPGCVADGKDNRQCGEEAGDDRQPDGPTGSDGATSTMARTGPRIAPRLSIARSNP